MLSQHQHIFIKITPSKSKQMRIHLKIKPSNKLLPHNYQPVVSAAIHRWIGHNEYHDALSLYSFSWFQGGKASKKGIQFPKGGRFFISSTESDFLIRIIEGVKKNPDINDDLVVEEVILQNDPEFQTTETLYAASPIFIKRKSDKGEKHFTFQDEESDELLTQTLKTRLDHAGCSSDGLRVEFDRSYHSPKVKLVYYRKIGNKASICPVKITGTPEQIAFAWNVGIGNSTGIGFGALK